jgi:DNA-binding LacI/PurR family transcriptional regulator
MVSLKEVAKRAGVSIATVSRVLSNTSYVSKETRERVTLAIEELGYTPNLAARALSKGRTHIIGFIFPHKYDLLFFDPYINTIAQGVETVCNEHGYNLLLNTPRPPIHQSEQFLRIMRSRYLDGVITVENLPNESARAKVVESGYPCVSIGSQADERPFNTLDVDDVQGGYDLASFLIALGHRRFGIIGVNDTELTSAHRRLQGYRMAFENAGIVFEEVPQVYGTFSVQSGYEVIDELIQRARPTAILCLNDRMAMGAIQRLQFLGFSVPEDVTVVGFDDIPGADYFNPPLTTIRQPAHKLGATATLLLFDMIGKKEGALERFKPLVFQPELVIRASAAPPKEAGTY